MREIEEFMDENHSKTKLRIRIEYQYAESQDFFALFSMLTLHKQADLDVRFRAIQYQEYTRRREERLPLRAISFPKYLMLELAQTARSSGVTSLVRIYERKLLDHELLAIGDSKLVYLYVEGKHVNERGSEVQDMSANSGLIEEVI